MITKESNLFAELTYLKYSRCKRFYLSIPLSRYSTQSSTRGALGDKITMLRKQKNLSQGDLADKLGVSRDSIGKYERNDIMPTADKAKKMADILGVSLDFLMSDAVKEDTVIDNDMLYRMQEVQKLPDSEKDKINSIIDAFVRDTKAKQAFRIS
jgi:transcriptional regulator with XRE-family HTH domain